MEKCDNQQQLVDIARELLFLTDDPKYSKIIHDNIDAEEQETEITNENDSAQPHCSKDKTAAEQLNDLIKNTELPNIEEFREDIKEYTH